MSSRTHRRRQNLQLQRVLSLSPEHRQAEGARLLTQWRVEADRRADDLGAPQVWDLLFSKRDIAWELDFSGELAAELSRVCAEAIGRVLGRHLVGGSRPLADRSRLLIRPSSGSRL
jgi:hypothetical protein